MGNEDVIREGGGSDQARFLRGEDDDLIGWLNGEKQEEDRMTDEDWN